MGLIVIEGLDGVGKSTQISGLSSYLTANGYHCRQQHFPRFECPVYGELIGRFLRGEMGDINQVDPYLTALMYAGDRDNFKPTLENWMKQGDMILLDRYVYSNVAYQCAKLTEKEEKQNLRQWILDLEFEYNKLPKPELNIFLDAPVMFTQKKLTGIRNEDPKSYLQGKTDIHETNHHFQKNVREEYLFLTETVEEFVKIDCSDGQDILPVDQILDQILNVINDKILKK